MQKEISMVKIYHWFDLFGVTIKWISKLPCQHDDHIDGQQYANHHKQLVVFDNFFIELNISENGMNTPGFREHCTERQTESSH